MLTEFSLNFFLVFCLSQQQLSQDRGSLGRHQETCSLSGQNTTGSLAMLTMVASQEEHNREGDNNLVQEQVVVSVVGLEALSQRFA